jgi:hypothetical protein
MLPNYCNKIKKQYSIVNLNEINNLLHKYICMAVYYLDSFWNDVKILLEKLRIGIHILSLKNLVFGYKIEDEYYNLIYY